MSRLHVVEAAPRLLAPPPFIEASYYLGISGILQDCFVRDYAIGGR
jgi:hypothetical protein